MPTTTAGTTYYRVAITDSASGCNDPVSSAVSVTVLNQAAVTVSATNNIICLGGSSVISSVVTNGSGTISYQWQVSPNGTSGWSNVSPGGNGPTYNVPSTSTGSFYYRLLVSDQSNGCEDPISNVVNVVIVPSPSVTIQPDSIVVCVTDQAPPLSAPSMGWVVLGEGQQTGSCVSQTDCANNVICFALQYTPNQTGILTDYTTGFFIDCDGGSNPVVSNTSCVMTDASMVQDGCVEFNMILMNSSGN